MTRQETFVFVIHVSHFAFHSLHTSWSLTCQPMLPIFVHSNVVVIGMITSVHVTLSYMKSAHKVASSSLVIALLLSVLV